MKKSIAFAVSVSLMLAGSIKGNAYEELSEEKLYARSAVLMDADSGRILYAKNGEEERAMASTTKIMTCILVLEESEMDQVVTVSQNAASQPKVHLGMREGEEFYVEDLLYSLMLESHNDTAVALAETVGGSVEGFAGKMNEKAKQLGLTDTHFVTPNGLDGEDEGGTHHTTAEDLAAIMRYCVMESPKKEEFLEITEAPSHTFTDLAGKRSYTAVNHNAFLTMMEGALSGKTGYTNEAGYCYVGALRQDERTYIVALLGCGWPNNRNYKWSDSKRLFQYGLDNFHMESVSREISLEPVAVEDGVFEDSGIGEQVWVELEEEDKGEISLLLSEKDELKLVLLLPRRLKAPIRQGEKVGEIRYLLNGEVLCSHDVTAKEDVERIGWRWCMEKVAERYLMKEKKQT